jgi:hypothetical protein
MSFLNEATSVCVFVISQDFMGPEVDIKDQPIIRVRLDDHPTTRMHPTGHKPMWNLLIRHNIKILTAAELLAIQFRIWEVPDSKPAQSNWYNDWGFM